MKKAGIYIICFLVIFFSSSHDYWFHSAHLKIAKGETIKLNLLVGDDLIAEAERPLSKVKTDCFKIISADKTIDLLPISKDSITPVLTYTAENEGQLLIDMRRNFSFISLSDSAFTNYLKHESLQHVLEMRSKLPPRQQERERYARSLKCLVQVGNASKKDTAFKKVLGQELEIILMQNPYLLKPNSVLKAKLLYRGKPLANHPLFALNRMGKNNFTELVQKTNADGVVSFSLSVPGLWVIRTVHLFPCDNCKDADWESQWAAYSFELPS